MTPNDYSEDNLIEKPAVDLLGSLDWETFNAFGEFEQGQSPPSRDNKSEGVLTSSLLPALEKLNPDVPDERTAAITIPWS